MSEVDLHDQVAFVTGAGRGIGRAIALKLARAGCDVVLAARTTSQLEEVAAEIRKTGRRALPAPTDVTDEESVQNSMDLAVNTFGRVHILVNNAGSNNGGPNGSIGPLWEINAKAWWRDVEINLLGTVLCSKAALAHMVVNKQGRIINISSMSAVRVAPFDSAYACAKASVCRLTASVAAEVEPHGISVFAVSPGPVRTALTEGVFETEAGAVWLGDLSNSLKDNWQSPEVTAEFVAELASGRGDALTGRFFRVTDDLGDLIDRAGDIRRAGTHQLCYVPG